MLVPLSTGAPKNEMVDNIGLQSHGGAARLFNSNTGIVPSQQSTTGQLYGVSQPTHARDTGVTWEIDSCMTFTDPLIPNRSITSTGASSHMTPTCVPMATIR